MNPRNFFNIDGKEDFYKFALSTFRFQAKNNLPYKKFIDLLGVDVHSIKEVEEIPFLPIEFFKNFDILSSKEPVEQVFLSSGTTGSVPSKHLVTDLGVYEESFIKGFEFFYNKIDKITVLGLLPNYLERNGSSLVYMVSRMIDMSNSKDSGFYLNNLEELALKLSNLDAKGHTILLIGVSYALLDLVESKKFKLKNTIIMETGGMKGRRKEMVRSELHGTLMKGFGVSQIHSEYGMTELLSQAYSKGNGIFETPPWMRVLIRDTEDPFNILSLKRTGGVNIIDLANINSCSFIATQDLGRKIDENRFEILGRFDQSDIRGCNLMVV